MAAWDRRRALRRDPALLLWFRLARVYLGNLQAASRQLRRWQLSAAQFDVLVQVGSAEGLTQKELARRLLVTQGNVTQLLHRLERRGLLRRERGGKANRLFLTEAGRALYEEVVPAQERLQASLFAPLTPGERRALGALLRKLVRAQRTGDGGGAAP